MNVLLDRLMNLTCVCSNYIWPGCQISSRLSRTLWIDTSTSSVGKIRLSLDCLFSYHFRFAPLSIPRFSEVCRVSSSLFSWSRVLYVSFFFKTRETHIFKKKSGNVARYGNFAILAPFAVSFANMPTSRKKILFSSMRYIVQWDKLESQLVVVEIFVHWNPGFPGMWYVEHFGALTSWCLRLKRKRELFTR